MVIIWIVQWQNKNALSPERFPCDISPPKATKQMCKAKTLFAGCGWGGDKAHWTPSDLHFCSSRCYQIFVLFCFSLLCLQEGKCYLINKTAYHEKPNMGTFLRLLFTMTKAEFLLLANIQEIIGQKYSCWTCLFHQAVKGAFMMQSQIWETIRKKTSNPRFSDQGCGKRGQWVITICIWLPRRQDLSATVNPAPWMEQLWRQCKLTDK